MTKLTFNIAAELPKGGYFTVVATDDSREFGFHDITFATSDKSGWNIDWGDGTVQSYPGSRSQTKLRHAYAKSGTYTVFVPDVASLIAIAGYEDSSGTEEETTFFRTTAPAMLRAYTYLPIDRGPTTMSYFMDAINTFRNCVNLAEVDFSRAKLSTFMSTLAGCSSLKRLGFPIYCTAVGGDPFAGCAALEGEIDLGDTRRITADGSALPFRDCPRLAKVRIRGRCTSG